MKFQVVVVQRLVVLIALIVGLTAPALTAATPSRAAGPHGSFARIDRLLAADSTLGFQADKKKLPEEETPTAEDVETPTAVDEETPTAVDEETPTAVDEETPTAVDEETPTAVDEETPTAPDEQAPATNDALFGVLGGTRADFEDEFGTPVDDADASDFALGEVYADIRGYDSIIVFWDNDVALHIQLNAKTGWSETKSLSTAGQFLPTDVELDSNATELDGGELLYAGSSEALSQEVSRSTYHSYDVGGTSGDLRVILIPDDSNTFATVDIAIGAGDEFAGGSAQPTAEPTAKARKTPRATEEPSKTPRATEESKTGGTANADEYLTNIRTEVDARQKELDRILEIVDAGDSATVADTREFNQIFKDWLTLPTFEAPTGYEEIDDAYTSLVKNLADASSNLDLGVSTNDDSLIELAASQLQTAGTLLTDLDEMLTTEGY